VLKISPNPPELESAKKKRVFKAPYAYRTAKSLSNPENTVSRATLSPITSSSSGSSWNFLSNTTH